MQVFQLIQLFFAKLVKFTAENILMGGLEQSPFVHYLHGRCSKGSMEISHLMN